MSDNKYLRLVRSYFTDQEWSEMPDLMKERYANIKRNYDITVSLDLKPAMPEFMKSKPVAPKAVAKNSAESRSKKQRQLKKPADTAQAPKTGAKGKENSGGVKLAPRKKTSTAPVKHSAVLTDNKQLAAGAATDQKTAEVDVAAPREVFSCEDCGDQFTVKQLLDNHRRRKHMQRPQGKHQCAHCPYSSNYRSHVTKHERIHTGERPFVCHVCDRRFTERGHLNKHMRVHTGEKPHECPDCGQRFTEASNMARHRRLHHSAENSRGHVCPECGKGFTLRDSLNRHLLTHTGEKPHSCSQCGMRFADRSAVKKHEQIIHGRQYPLHCPHCGKGCVNMYDLRRHVLARHRDEEDDDKENDEDQGRQEHPGEEKLNDARLSA